MLVSVQVTIAFQLIIAPAAICANLRQQEGIIIVVCDRTGNAIGQGLLGK